MSDKCVRFASEFNVNVAEALDSAEYNWVRRFTLATCEEDFCRSLEILDGRLLNGLPVEGAGALARRALGERRRATNARHHRGRLIPGHVYDWPAFSRESVGQWPRVRAVGRKSRPPGEWRCPPSPQFGCGV